MIFRKDVRVSETVRSVIVLCDNHDAEIEVEFAVSHKFCVQRFNRFNADYHQQSGVHCFRLVNLPSFHVRKITGNFTSQGIYGTFGAFPETATVPWTQQAKLQPLTKYQVLIWDKVLLATNEPVHMFDFRPKCDNDSERKSLAGVLFAVSPGKDSTHVNTEHFLYVYELPPLHPCVQFHCLNGGFCWNFTMDALSRPSFHTPSGGTQNHNTATPFVKALSSASNSAS